MSTAAALRMPESVRGDERIIPADSHVIEPVDLWDRNLPPGLKEKYPKMPLPFMEEIERVRRGKRGARSTKQAIAIGLSKARREGVKLPPPPKGKTSESTRKKAAADVKRGQSAKKKPTLRRRSRASSKALRREGRGAASKESLSRAAKNVR